MSYGFRMEKKDSISNGSTTSDITEHVSPLDDVVNEYFNVNKFMSDNCHSKMDLILYELRSSADIIYRVFTKGACFRLYRMIKVIFPQAEAWWSDSENHTIIKLHNKFYDIGGEIRQNYVYDGGFYKIPVEQLSGYYLLKYTDNDDIINVKVSKYV